MVCSIIIRVKSHNKEYKFLWDIEAREITLGSNTLTNSLNLLRRMDICNYRLRVFITAKYKIINLKTVDRDFDTEGQLFTQCQR